MHFERGSGRTAPALRAQVDPKSSCFDLIASDRSYAAIDPLERWVKQVPHDAVAWQLLANAYRAEQRIGDAHRAFERMSALRPDDPKAMLGLATTAYEAGLPSAHLFGWLVSRGHATPDVILASVAALTAEGQQVIAEQLLERALRERPDWVAGHEALASLRWRYGDPERVEQSFAASTAAVGSLELWIAWIRLLTRVNRRDRALDVLDAGRRRFGAMAPFDALEASIAAEAGDHARADALFLRAQGLNDDATRIAHVRHCIRTGAIDRAQALLDPLLAGPQANAAWPYQSVIWRLEGDERALWLDGLPVLHHVSDLGLPAADFDPVVRCLAAPQQQRRHPFDQSPRGGTQTEGNFLDRQTHGIPQLRQALVEAVRAYAAALPSDPAHPFLGAPRSDIRFAGSWSITLRAQGYHECHTHPQGWLSGVLYVNVPEDTDLGGASHGALELGRPPSDLKTDLPAYTHVRPVKGRLVLFPSTLWHATIPFDHGIRASIAFDVLRPRY